MMEQGESYLWVMIEHILCIFGHWFSFIFCCLNSSILKKSSFWILCFVAFLIFASVPPSDDVSAAKNKKKRAKKLRNKAEVAPVEVVQKQSEINHKIDLNEKYAQLEVSAPNAYGDGKFDDMEQITETSYDEEEENLDLEIDEVIGDIDEAEEEEIEINDSMLVSAVRNIENNVKTYFGRIFGTEDGDSSDFIDDLAADSEDDETSSDIKLSDEQLDLIAKKIADRLESDVKKDFRTKADVIAEEKVEGKLCWHGLEVGWFFVYKSTTILTFSCLHRPLLAEIDKVIHEDRNAALDATKIKDDVAEAEKVVVEDLKDEIDKAAISVKDSLEYKMKKIRNEVMEEETGRNMDYIERKKRERREKMMAKAQKKYEERLQKRKEFDEAEKARANKVVSSGKEKYYQAPKKVMPVGSDDEEPRGEKKPSDKKGKYNNGSDASGKYYQASPKKAMPESSDEEEPRRQKKEKYVHDEKDYYDDEESSE